MKRSTPLRMTSPVAKASKPIMRNCAAKGCENRFQKRSMGHVACSSECAMKVVGEKKAKVERASDKVRREALKDRGDWLAEAQIAFNAYIRYRDRNQLCICCNKPFQPQRIGGSVDAGHFRSRGSAPHLRFDERNVHAQRKNCNRPGGTTYAAFRTGMIARIGLEAVEALECDQVSREYTIDDLKAIKATYRAKLKELMKAGE